MPGKRTKSYKCFFWSLALLSGSLFFSCANEDCVSIFNNHLLVGFYESEISENGEYPEIDTVFYSVKADGNDLVFYTPDTTLSVLTLPVDPAKDFTSFELTMLDSISYDSLNNPTYYVNPNPHFITVSYDLSQRIISVDCGVEIRYTNLSVGDITFPTYTLVENKLSRLNEVNIEVFF